jgi:hypothetical protein
MATILFIAACAVAFVWAGARLAGGRPAYRDDTERWRRVQEWGRKARERR